MILRASLLLAAFIYTSSVSAQESGLERLREKMEENAKENIEKAQLVWEQNKNLRNSKLKPFCYQFQAT